MNVSPFTQVTAPQMRIETEIEQGQAQKPEKEEFGFFDLLDMINPLQHIPVVSTIYRELSGDTIKPISRIIGGAAFGGVAGAGMGVVNMIAEHSTGRDVGQNALALVSREKEAYAALPTNVLLYAQEPQTALEREAQRYNS